MFDPRILRSEPRETLFWLISFLGLDSVLRSLWGQRESLQSGKTVELASPGCGRAKSKNNPNNPKWVEVANPTSDRNVLLKMSF